MYDKATLETIAASSDPADRRKMVEIFKELGLKMAEIVAIAPDKRVERVLEEQKKKGGKAAPAGATKAAPAKAAPVAAAKAKGAAKAPEPEPEPDGEDEAAAVVGGVSEEALNGAVELIMGKFEEVLAAVQESTAAATRAGALTKLSIQLSGLASDEEIEEVVGN